MKKIIYTAITGDYDTLPEPLWKGDWEFICYTTNKHLTSKNWKIIYIAPEEDLVRQARRIKIAPPFKYDMCLWVDGNIQITGNIDEFIRPFKNEPFALMKHPHRINIIQEGFAIAKYQKDKIQTIEKQIFDYIKEGYQCNELSATGIIYRKNEEIVRKISEIWCEEIDVHSYRDQMSLDYVLWRLNTTVVKFDYIPQNYFLYHAHQPFKTVHKPTHKVIKGRGRVIIRKR